ncbi:MULTISPECIES: response regulator [unclassified Roseofilum]|nr:MULTISPECIES: response regulator [unclassified Roseofilum]
MIQSFNSNLSPQLLVVDDFTENLRLLKTVLQQQGYEVRLAANGKFALTSLDHFQPDLILLDIMMPEMNGYLFCQELKQNPKTSDIPVIFLSALQEGMDKAKAFQLGGADYLTKPFQMEELLARVKHHLELRDLQRELQLNNNFLEIKNRQL